MDQNPYSPPNAPLGDPSSSDKVEDVANAQRKLLLGILASLVGNMVMRSGGEIGLLLIPIALGIAAFNIWCVYKLCKALGTSPILWILAMFVPLINLICLVLLNQRATAYLKSQGLEVGLLGVKR